MSIRLTITDLPARAKVLSAEEMRQVFGGCGAPQFQRPRPFDNSAHGIVMGNALTAVAPFR